MAREPAQSCTAAYAGDGSPEEMRAIIDARRLVAIAASDSENLTAEGRYMLHWVRRRLADRADGLFSIVDRL